MAPTRPSEVNPVLTAIAIAYRNPDYTLINVPDDLRVGRLGQPVRVEFSAKQQTGEVEDWGVDTAIPKSDVDAAARQRNLVGGHYDPRARAVEGLTDIVNLGHEVRTARLVFNLQTYAPDRRITLAGTSQLSDYANSDPFTVFDTAMSGTLVFKPNTAVFGDEAWRVVRGHPHLVNAVRGGVTNKGRITPDEFAALFGLRSVFIGEGWLNTARKGQEPNLERVWGRHCAFLHLATSPNTEKTVTFGYTARLGTRIADEYEDKRIGLEGATIVRVGERAKELIIAPDVGYFIQNIVAGD